MRRVNTLGEISSLDAGFLVVDGAVFDLSTMLDNVAVAKLSLNIYLPEGASLPSLPRP